MRNKRPNIIKPEAWSMWFAMVKFEERMEYKTRPVVILSGDEKTVSALYCTSKPPRKAFDYVLQDWRRAGLKQASTVVTDRELSLDTFLLLHKIGDLGLDDIWAICECRDAQRENEKAKSKKSGCYIATAVVKFFGKLNKFMKSCLDKLVSKLSSKGYGDM